MRALASDRDKRFQTAADLASSLSMAVESAA